MPDPLTAAAEALLSIVEERFDPRGIDLHAWLDTDTRSWRDWLLAIQSEARATADAEVARLRAALDKFMEAFEETGVHEHERDDDHSIDLCIPIAPLKPVYWAACAALGHRWTVVNVEPFCERCGFRDGDDERREAGER